MRTSALDASADNPTPTEGLQTDEIAGAGFIEDKFGHKWTKPQADEEDETIGSDDLYFPAQDRLREEGFYHYYEHVDKIQGAIARGFVPVTREEAGLRAVEGLSEYGSPDYMKQPHRVGSLVLMKAPQFIYDRVDKRRSKDAKDKIRSILSDKEMKRLEAEGNVMRQDEQDFRVSASPTKKE